MGFHNLIAVFFSIALMQHDMQKKYLQKVGQAIRRLLRCFAGLSSEEFEKF